MDIAYWKWLLFLSLPFIVIERLRPRDAKQAALRPGILHDIFYLAFNGHYFSMILAVVLGSFWAELDSWFAASPLGNLQVVKGWPLWLETIVALVVLDFVQWCVHNALHRVPFLWRFHRLHHSIVDMDWIGSFRFHWLEVIVYNSVRYLPLMVFGFSGEAMMIFALVGTTIGHFNHANVNIDIGIMGRIINNPKMHIWHHNIDPGQPRHINFGIALSVWDYMFGTAYVPDHPPDRLGLAADDQFPRRLWRQLLLPWTRAPSDSAD